MESRLLSGIQPTGIIHLGNYLGAIKNWVRLVNEGKKAFVFIADLHSLTIPQNLTSLRDRIVSTAATYIASGLSPKRCNIFVQSEICEHAELAWILSCFTATGWMNRMTQFKEKSLKYKNLSSLGLYIYPVLQAADILLYQPDQVPIGEDQKQHVELTRDIADSFNRATNRNLFKLPDPIIFQEGARIKSLRNGMKKMSKSDDSDYSRINLTDSKDTIKTKIQKAKSDSIEKIYYDKENRPEVSNLLNIFSCFSDKKIKEIEKEYENSTMPRFKSDLSELIIASLFPVSQEIKLLLKDKSYIVDILKHGKEQAKQIASDTLKEVKKTVGLL